MSSGWSRVRPRRAASEIAGPRTPCRNRPGSTRSVRSTACCRRSCTRPTHDCSRPARSSSHRQSASCEQAGSSMVEDRAVGAGHRRRCQTAFVSMACAVSGAAGTGDDVAIGPLQADERKGGDERRGRHGEANSGVIEVAPDLNVRREISAALTGATSHQVRSSSRWTGRRNTCHGPATPAAFVIGGGRNIAPAQVGDGDPEWTRQSRAVADTA